MPACPGWAGIAEGDHLEKREEYSLNRARTHRQKEGLQFMRKKRHLFWSDDWIWKIFRKKNLVNQKPVEKPG